MATASPWVLYRSVGFSAWATNWWRCRPDHRPGWPPHQAALSRASAPHPLQGRRDRQDVGVLNKQLRSAGVDHRRPLQKQVASGAIFQMDQAAPSDQAVLWDLGKRGQDPD